MADDRYNKTRHDGKVVDKWTKAALQAAEKELGYELSIVQGSYNRGVGASAGTHDGGGVVDLLAWDRVRKVKVLRRNGFAAWYRPTLRGVWSAHIHAVLINNAKASSGAKSQVTAYRNGRNGLANNGRDTEWRPNPIKPFDYEASQKPAPKPAPVPTPHVGVCPAPDPVPPAARQRRKIMTYNPSDKLGNTAARAKLVVEMALGGQIGVPDIIAFQELGGRKGEGIPSAWAALIDAALPENFRLFVPTTNFNENYTAINLDTTEHVKVLADHIIRVPGAAGKHCSRVITKDKVSGKTLLVGNVHIDPYTSVAKRSAQALDAWQSLKDEYDKGGIDDFVLCGDFNHDVFPPALTAKNQRDAGTLAAKRINWEFESFSGTDTGLGKRPHIDFISVHRNETVHVAELVQIRNTSGTRLKSPKAGDHQPVAIDVTLN